METFPTWSAFSFPTCQLDGENFRNLEQSHRNKEHGSPNDSVELCNSTDLHCTMTWEWGSWKWAVRGGQDLFWPQPLSPWIYYCICAKTTFPRGCSQSRTTHGRCKNSDPFLQDTGFLQQVTLTYGVSTDRAESFLELPRSPEISLPNFFPFLLSFSGIRSALWSESSPVLRWHLFILHRCFPPINLCMSNLILASASQ